MEVKQKISLIKKKSIKNSKTNMKNLRKCLQLQVRMRQVGPRIRSIKLLQNHQRIHWNIFYKALSLMVDHKKNCYHKIVNTTHKKASMSLKRKISQKTNIIKKEYS